uniref:Uncharacterized protein n=1 Tax=Physcomitrium patens TaxID=3218 RepID=A0A7I4A182_PHYPA
MIIIWNMTMERPRWHFLLKLTTTIIAWLQSSLSPGPRRCLFQSTWLRSSRRRRLLVVPSIPVLIAKIISIRKHNYVTCSLAPASKIIAVCLVSVLRAL